MNWERYYGKRLMSERKMIGEDELVLVLNIFHLDLELILMIILVLMKLILFHHLFNLIPKK